MIKLPFTMSDRNPPKDPQRSYLEYNLVRFMLLFLTILIFAILLVPISGGGDTIEFRRVSLTVVVTAFSAWIGAGAAYFFGKENLRVATEAIKEVSIPPKERLAKTPVTLEAREIDWTVKKSNEIGIIIPKISDPKAQRWFIVVVKDDGTLDTVLEEDAVWHFIQQESEKNTLYATIIQTKVGDLLKWVRDNDLPYDDINVIVKPTDTLQFANEHMDRQECYLAIIVDANKKPVSYTTTSVVRKLLLQ